MRRRDREITDVNEMYKIIDECSYCRVGFNDAGEVYIVPMNFGYDINEDVVTLYFHSAKLGRKISIIEKSPNVGFEMDTNYKLEVGEIAGKCTARYKSVIGNGVASFVDTRDEKINALQRLMYQSTKKDNWEFDENSLEAVRVFKITVEKITCKVNEV